MDQSHRPNRAKRLWYKWREMGVRRDVGGIMLIMGFGRLGLYRTTALADVLSMEVYGALLVGMGLLVIIAQPWRTRLWARISAILGAALLVGMAADGAHFQLLTLCTEPLAALAALLIGTTVLLELWFAYLLAEEALS